MKPSGIIRAYPNPIHVSDAFEGPFPLAQTTLSWDSHATDAVEVHVDSPSGPLLAYSGPSGSTQTGPWVRDGMVFYLQNVSGELARTSSYTLATVQVGVTTPQGATTYRQWQTVFAKLRLDLANLLSRPGTERAQETFRNEPGRETRIVVLSGITPHNLGDDAMLIALVRQLKEWEPGLQITVLAENPELCGPVARQIDASIEKSLNLFMQALLHFYPTGRDNATLVQSIARRLLQERRGIAEEQLPEWVPAEFLSGLRSLTTADGVIDCGGSYHCDHWKWYLYEKCLDYYLASKPLYVTGQGIDKLAEPLDADLLRHSLFHAELTTVREPISERYLRSIGCNGKIRTTGDDAITLPVSSPERVRELLEAAGMETAKPYLALHFRRFLDCSEDETLERSAQYVESAIQITGLTVVGVPMHFLGHDERIHLRELADRLQLKNRFFVVGSELIPSDAKALFARAQLTFGFSYHSGIFSLSAGTPFLGIYAGSHYEQKMRGIAELYNLPWLPIPVQSTSPAEFAQILKRVLDRRRAIVDQLRTKQAELRAEVEETRRRFLSEVGEMRMQRQRIART